MPGKADIRAHADELLHVHEPVFKNGFADDPGTFGKAHEGHDLRLHVRREAGERKRLDVDRLDTLGTAHMDAVVGTLAIDAHKLHLLEHHAQVNGAKARDIDTAIVGHQRTGNDKGTGLDAVAHHAMGNGMELFHAFDSHDGRTGADNLGAHLVEHVSEIDDLGSRAALSITWCPVRAQRP